MKCTVECEARRESDHPAIAVVSKRETSCAKVAAAGDGNVAVRYRWRAKEVTRLPEASWGVIEETEGNWIEETRRPDEEDPLVPIPDEVRFECP